MLVILDDHLRHGQGRRRRARRDPFLPVPSPSSPKPEPLVEPQRGSEALDVDAQRLSGSGRFLLESVQQRRPDAAVAVLVKQAEAAKVRRVTQPRVSDLLHGRIDLFSTDTLIDMLARLGVGIRLVIKTPRWQGSCSQGKRDHGIPLAPITCGTGPFDSRCQSALS